MSAVISCIISDGLKADFSLKERIGGGCFGEVYICSVLNADPILKIPSTVA